VSGDAQDVEPPQFLPQHVEVSEQKIRNYLLDVNHRDGGSKAKFFIARGFSDLAWLAFANAIRQHPIDNPIRNTEATDYGLKVIVQCTLRTPDGGNPCIRTVWMQEGTHVPRLVTAYPSKD
jgi:hypothetical protein